MGDKESLGGGEHLGDIDELHPGTGRFDTPLPCSSNVAAPWPVRVIINTSTQVTELSHLVNPQVSDPAYPPLADFLGFAATSGTSQDYRSFPTASGTRVERWFGERKGAT